MTDHRDVWELLADIRRELEALRAENQRLRDDLAALTQTPGSQTALEWERPRLQRVEAREAARNREAAAYQVGDRLL